MGKGNKPNERIRTNLEVSGAVDDLVSPVGEAGIPLSQHALHPDDEGALQLDILPRQSGL